MKKLAICTPLNVLTEVNYCFLARNMLKYTVHFYFPINFCFSPEQKVVFRDQD